MSAVNADATLASVLSGATFGWAGLRAAHLPRSPRSRISLYVEVPRVHLGGSPGPASTPVVAREALRRVLGPLAGGAVAVVERLVRVAPPEKLELSLRQAGMNMSADSYRRDYLRWLIGTPVILGAVGLLTGRASYVVLFFIAGIFAGARRLPERVKARARRRCERLRSELPTVAAVLALKIENNKSLVVSVADVVCQGSGPVIDDLGRAIHLIDAGYGEAPAFELLATEAAEPAAARFYRFLAAATGGGLDLARALLDQANELRVQRREEVERSAARRQMSLVVPNLVFMTPVLFVFLLAPLPQLLFGK
jgi:tight adherence protein C